MLERTARCVLNDYIEQLEIYLRDCTNLEDRYREIGLLYHQTVLAARLSCKDDPLISDRLLELQNAFELTTPAQYDEYFERLDNIIGAFTELLVRAKHVPETASEDNVKEEILGYLNPLLAPQWKAWTEESTNISNLYKHVLIVRQINMDWHQVRSEDGFVLAWHDQKIHEDGSKDVLLKGEEWSTFRNWVSTLPEARRSMEIGETLDDIAKRMLWQEEEEKKEREKRQEEERIWWEEIWQREEDERKRLEEEERLRKEAEWKALVDKAREEQEEKDRIEKEEREYIEWAMEQARRAGVAWEVWSTMDEFPEETKKAEKGEDSSTV